MQNTSCKCTQVHFQMSTLCFRCYTVVPNLRGPGQEGTRWETAALAPASASAEPASLSRTHCDTCT